MKNLLCQSIFLITFCTLISAQKREFIESEINTPLTKELGEPLVTSGEIVLTEGLIITESFEVKSGVIKFQHQEGQFYPLVCVKKGLKIYYAQENLKDGRYWGIGINEKNMEEGTPVLVSIVGIVAKMKNYSIQNKINQTTQVSFCDGCFRQEFIYNGKKGNVANFTYREFIGHTIRPSFFQNIEYDIEDSNIIGFKGLRLKILKTTNTYIEYEILDNFYPIN